MKTLTDLCEQAGVQVDDHLATGLDIPVHAGIQAQGDLLVVPAGLLKGRDYPAADRKVPAQGVELLRGAHPHILVADPGTCTYRLLADAGIDLAVVDAAASVHLLHPEHGGVGIAPGRYVVRRQREQADEQRLVAD